MADKRFSRVIVDNASRKKSPADLGGHLSTSFQFGEVLPVHCRKLTANSTHTVGTRSLVRLDPMVAPTSQGRMTVKMWHSFIGMSDLFRHYAAFQTGKSIGGSNGLVNFSKLPSMRLSDLSLFCLVGAQVTPYVLDTSNGENFDSPKKKWHRFKDTSSANSYFNIISYSVPNSIGFSQITGSAFERRFPNYASTGVNFYFDVRMLGFNPTGYFSNAYLPLGNTSTYSNFALTLFNGADVDIAHCDFVFYKSFVDPNTPTTTHYMAFAVNMSNYGARIFDILTVLGIGVDFQSLKLVDLCRIFAYYMAYYGSFGLSKYTNFESSNCNRILKAYENGGNNFNPFDFGDIQSTQGFGDSPYLNDLFFNFMTDLAVGYVTEAVDYIASHRRSDNICNDELGWIDNIITAPYTPVPGGSIGQSNAGYQSNVNPRTNSVFINNVNHTQVDSELLKILWKTTNRQSVAGQKLESLLRAGGFGDYVDQQQSHFLGYTDYDIDVTDINATSDSVNTVTGKNSTLGQYVGKGIGAQKEDKTFTYSPDEAGYWITLAAIVPDSSYCQGNDLTVYDVERTDQYQLEFDSIGYEVHPFSVVKCGADVCRPTDTSPSDSSFGIVPREMRYKVGHSIIAGNFRRRSTRDQYLPFVLSRWLDVDDIYESESRQTSSTDDVITTSDCQSLLSVPIAGDSWRFINLYPWLANFERIFAFDKKVRGAWATPSLYNRYVYCADRFDYFQMYLNVMHKCMSDMLPVSDSWQTTDDNDGKGSVMIQQ